MSETLSSPFFQELTEYLVQDGEKRLAHKALSSGGELSEEEKRLKKAIEERSFLEMLESYQGLFSDEGPVQIEKKLIEAFGNKAPELRIVRGLPRLYHRTQPARSHVKKEFSDLPSLKRLALERFLLPLYREARVPMGSRICILTWVISDGRGDWVAAKEISAILREKIPEATVESIAFVPAHYGDLPGIPYDKEAPLTLLEPHHWEMLARADLILSAPTYYPHTEELMHELARRKAFPRLVCLGQYGYIESDWFHPKSENPSMGLHFLEKGILIRKPLYANFSQIENRELLQLLFKTESPGPGEIEGYLNQHHFYLAYLLPGVGGSVYLHALLQMHRRDTLPIDICTPDIGWLVAHIERQKKEGRPLLEGQFGVGEFEIHYQGAVHAMQVAQGGKKVRILCPGPISDEDFRLLVRLSGEFVGVRGDQSFSEVVSANRAFFYDGAPHARYFVKDLLALSENRLAGHRSSLTVFRGMGKAFLYALAEEEGDWVEETYFQEKEPWLEIARTIGNAWLDPDALAGFKKFNRILSEEYACNEYLVQMARRELVHKANPSVARAEEKQIALFATQHLPLADFLKKSRQT